MKGWDHVPALISKQLMSAVSLAAPCWQCRLGCDCCSRNIDGHLPDAQPLRTLLAKAQPLRGRCQHRLGLRRMRPAVAYSCVQHDWRWMPDSLQLASKLTASLLLQSPAIAQIHAKPISDGLDSSSSSVTLHSTQSTPVNPASDAHK